MPLTLDGLDLIGTQESQSSTEAQANVTSAPSQQSDESLLVSLESAESTPLSGTATGIRLTKRSDYPSDPAAALSQWVQQFETLANPEQGVGYTLVDDERDREVRVIVKSVTWTLAEGAPYEVRWELEADRGEGVLGSTPRRPTTASPNGSTTLDGTGLGSVQELRMERSLDVSVTPIAYADESESVLTPGSGTVRRATLSGRVGGTPTELRDFEDSIRSLMGSNKQVTYQTGFPGTAHNVVVTQFEPTRQGGQPATMDYALTLLEGTVL